MKIGIDKMGFFCPDQYIEMSDLADARQTDPDKYSIGLGQVQMGVPQISQDIVTMAANAADSILSKKDCAEIDLIIFATESSFDESKSAAIYVQKLLDINPKTRSIEIKQACYSATAGIQFARGHILQNPNSKVLILASDIAKYGLNTPGEATQGAGAVAILISSNPKLIELDNVASFVTEDVMDFWRPSYSNYAFVDGSFSARQYLTFFKNVWSDYKVKANKTVEDFEAFCFHLPFTQMGYKALQILMKKIKPEIKERLLTNFDFSTRFNKIVGNIYTGSLYLSIISLLTYSKNLADKRIGLFSYGSGAVGEFFSGVVVEGYEKIINTSFHEKMISQRKQISISEYERDFLTELPTDGSDFKVNSNDSSKFQLSGIKNHQRQYFNTHDKQK
jgi:hydroxymethylglutaryl-CoA synthase